MRKPGQLYVNPETIRKGYVHTCNTIVITVNVTVLVCLWLRCARRKANTGKMYNAPFLNIPVCD